MPIDTGESAFKALFNRENTNDPPAKQFYEEKGRPALKLKNEDIWAELVDKADPNAAVVAGVAELRTLFSLTEDITVPGSATWTAEELGARLIDWIDVDDGDPTLNPVLSPHRIRIFDGADAEIFPTDPSLPFWNGKQGILRFGGPVTRPTPFKVTGYRYIGQKGISGGTSSGTTVAEDITFSVDYNDVTAVYLPADSSFTTQAEVDAYLASQGTTNVRDIETAYNALALVIPETVTITMNVAAGIQRPSGTGKVASWNFAAKIQLGQVVINGVAPSLWNVVSALSALDITAVSTNAGSASGGGSIQTSGTPFTGLDLRGHYVRLTTGQTTVISANTNDTIFTIADLSPAPGVGVDTFDIVEPATEFRNSIDDVARANNRAVSIDLPAGAGGSPFNMIWNNIKCTGGSVGGGAFFVQVTQNPAVQYNFVQQDVMNALPAALKDGGGWRYFDGTFAINEGAVRAIGVTSFDEHLFVDGSAVNSNAATSYFGGGDTADGIEVQNGAVLRLLGVLVDESSVQCRGGTVTMESFGGFFYEGTIQNTPGSNPALLWDNAKLFSTTLGQEYRIIGCTGPGVRIVNRSTLGQNVDFIDGGGNTDVGVEVGISHNLVELSGVTNVTGTVGDTRIAGVITAYGALPTQASALSGQEFDGFNLVNKG